MKRFLKSKYVNDGHSKQTIMGNIDPGITGKIFSQVLHSSSLQSIVEDSPLASY